MDVEVENLRQLIAADFFAITFKIECFFKQDGTELDFSFNVHVVLFTVNGQRRACIY